MLGCMIGAEIKFQIWRRYAPEMVITDVEPARRNGAMAHTLPPDQGPRDRRGP